eukprot:Pgem_evm1s9822
MAKSFGEAEVNHSKDWNREPARLKDYDGAKLGHIDKVLSKLHCRGDGLANLTRKFITWPDPKASAVIVPPPPPKTTTTKEARTTEIIQATVTNTESSVATPVTRVPLLAPDSTTAPTGGTASSITFGAIGLALILSI